MAILSPLPKMQFFSSAGVPLAGGKLYSYVAGTTTPLATYTTQAGTIANTNPIILDSRGEASVWLASSAYKLKLTTAADVELWTVDNISSAETFGASQLLSNVVGSDTITATVTSPNFTGYAAGQQFSFVVAATNTTTSVTLNLNGLGAKALTRQGVLSLNAGDLTAGQIALVEYDGTRFQFLNYVYTAPSGAYQNNFNRFINGGMGIDQRRAGAVLAGAATGTFCTDRWQYYFTAPAAPALTARISRNTSAPAGVGTAWSAQWECTTAHPTVAAGDFAEITQKIEGYNILDLIGQTFTISFWVYASKTGTYCVALSNSGTTNTYVAEYSVTAVNTWEYKTITVTGGLSPAMTWNANTGIGLWAQWTLMAGTTFQTTAGAWNLGNFLATSNQVNLGDATSGLFRLTACQLFLGSTAPAFEPRLFNQELSACRRYYQNNQSGYFGNTIRQGIALSATRALCAGTVSFSDLMRTAPAVTIYSPNGTAGALALYNVSGTDVGSGFTAAASVGGYSRVDGTAGLAAASYYVWYEEADAEL